MISVPAFLLRRLYVKGSLRNNDHGFEFQLCNTLGSGYARELLPLALDGEELPLERCFFSIDGQETPFAAVNPDQPFTLSLNRASTLVVKGMSLSEGAHKVRVGFVVQGIGTLSFDVTDVAQGGAG